MYLYANEDITEIFHPIERAITILHANASKEERLPDDVITIINGGLNIVKHVMISQRRQAEALELIAERLERLLNKTDVIAD